MAGYARWLEHMTFYEIDENIRNFSLPPKIKHDNGEETINTRFLFKNKDPFFTFVTDAIGRGTNLEIIMGDARLSMVAGTPGSQRALFDSQGQGGVLQENAGAAGHVLQSGPLLQGDRGGRFQFRRHSDSPDYRRGHQALLRQTGARWRDLRTHVESPHEPGRPGDRHRAALGKKYIVGHDTGTSRRETPPFLGHFGSEYVMLANEQKYLPDEKTVQLGPDNVQQWEIIPAPGRALWTDDFSNIISILR